MVALRIQLDTALWEKQELETENRRLRADNLEAAKVAELEKELAQSKAELAQNKVELQCMRAQLGEIPHLERDLDYALQEVRSLRQANAANDRGKNRDATTETELRRLTLEVHAGY